MYIKWLPITILQRKIISFLMKEAGHRKAYLLFGILCVLSCLDFLGVAIIYPFLRLITEQSLSSKLMNWLGLDENMWSKSQIVFVLGVVLILFYLGKMFLHATLMRAQFKLLARFTTQITNDLIYKILHVRYAVFQQTAASEMAGTISVSTHVSVALLAIVQALNDIFFLVLIFLAFLYIQPIFALGALFLVFFTTAIIYIILIRRSVKIGAALSKVENKRYRLLFTIASSIKDIKIMGLESMFVERNNQTSSEFAELNWRNSFFNSLPRVFIEFMALFSIVALSLCIVLFDIPMSKAGPLLALVVLAVFRAIPSFSRLLSAVSVLGSSIEYVKLLMGLREKLAGDLVKKNNDNLTFKHLIELKKINFWYGEKQILNNVCMQLNHGETIGIVGSSGAGKTTLLDVFTGLQPATSGFFLCDTVSYDPFTSYSIQKMIGYVPQSITLLDDTIAFNVTFDDNPNLNNVMRVLKMANLNSFIDSLPDGINTRIGENGLRLSGGQRQRLGIARALYRSPEILVFDEATSSLDTNSELELNSEIDKLHGKVSIVIVAHRLSSVINCDRIYVFSNGCIEDSGKHSDLLLTSPTYAKLYKTQSNT
jgi:ABC-type bacteriocin/lantibiotic exporter with double-glycine peptidase domain